MAAAAQELYVDGIGFWASRLPGWQVARDVLRGAAAAPEAPVPRPAPALLPPAERRRAPDTVAIALEVAARACESAARDPKSMASIFASTHGDLAITDTVCETLAKTPALLSPTKFHNSVLNAAAGYWTIGTGCLKPYTALSAFEHTFGEGLLESVSQAASENSAVLYVAYDIEARGPLTQVSPSRGVLAGALVLSPEVSEHSIARLRWEVRSEIEPHPTQARPENSALVDGNAMANCLALFEALADNEMREIIQTLAPQLTLRLRLEPMR